jgi:hypothetical protein
MPRNTPLRLQLAALLAAVPFLACTGNVEPATPDTPAAQGVNVAIAPEQVQVAAGAQVAFAATVTGTANTSVTWSVPEAAGGTVDANGLYTAPGSAGTFHVRATSNADPSKQAQAAVSVVAPQVVAITVSPASGAVDGCQTLQFTATVTGSTNTAATWGVQEGAAGGTVSTSGLYTAPANPGTYHVVATSVADPSKSVVAAVTVSERIVSVAVSPPTVTVAPGGTAQFTATVTNTCGTFAATRVVAVAQDGTVSVN